MSKSVFVNTLKGQKTDHVPFWLMRQAGRYLPEYRALREKAGSFLDLCFDPDFAVEVTLQPLRRFDMDAAILFSDILVVPYALGQDLSFVVGEGPKLGAMPDLTAVDLDAFHAKLLPVYQTVDGVRKNLADDKALIGFAGAPWTVACYMIEGQGGGGEFTRAKTFAFENPDACDVLIDKLADVTAQYLIRQAQTGVNAVQIFDSWAGLLPEPYFTRWVINPTRKIVSTFKSICPDVPVIGFPRKAAALYPHYVAETGVDAVSLDQYQPIAHMGNVTLQGNLDPVLLLAGGDALNDGVRRVLDAVGDMPFIFNLGHGVIKETPIAHVEQLSAIIKGYKKQ